MRGVRRLRCAAVRANVGPLGAAARRAHRGLARAIVALLRGRFPGRIEAAYLRGSVTTSVFVPGISDVDLLLVLRDATSALEHERIQVAYRRLARWCLVLDRTPWILRRFEVEKLYRENPSLRFRALETRAAGHLVYGPDALGTLPALPPADVALAHLFELKTKLAYFNAFCLTDAPDDALEALRREYLAFKMGLDLARASTFLATGESLFARDDVALRLLRAEIAAGPGLAPAEEGLLRSFVAHTRRWRLRRSFFDAELARREAIEGALLRWALATATRFYERPDVRASADLADEHEHVYAGGRFVPSGREVVLVPESSVADHGALRRRVLLESAAGRDVVLAWGELLVNLGNGDARVGHRTVVRRERRHEPLAQAGHTC